METIAVGYDGCEPARRALERAAERAEALSTSLADLLVVGAREHGLLERLLRRGVDESVARAAGCEVQLAR